MQGNMMSSFDARPNYGTEILPGDILRECEEIIEANFDGLRLKRRMCFKNDQLINLSIWLGSSMYSVQWQEAFGTARWRCNLGNAYSGRDPEQYTWVQEFIQRLLPALEQARAHIPWEHVPAVPVCSLDEENKKCLWEYVPGVFEASPEVQNRFGALFFTLAINIQRARQWAEEAQAKADLEKRLVKQFRALPTGVVLIHDWGLKEIGVVSDRKGSRTKRTLQVRGPGLACFRDLDRSVRSSFKLLTKERQYDVPSGVLSAHELLEALARSEELKGDFPDLV